MVTMSGFNSAQSVAADSFGSYHICRIFSGEIGDRRKGFLLRQGFSSAVAGAYFC